MINPVRAFSGRGFLITTNEECVAVYSLTQHPSEVVSKGILLFDIFTIFHN